MESRRLRQHESGRIRRASSGRVRRPRQRKPKHRPMGEYSAHARLGAAMRVCVSPRTRSSPLRSGSHCHHRSMPPKAPHCQNMPVRLIAQEFDAGQRWARVMVREVQIDYPTSDRRGAMEGRPLTTALLLGALTCASPSLAQQANAPKSDTSPGYSVLIPGGHERFGTMGPTGYRRLCAPLSVGLYEWRWRL
jgi:hypothetical protein